MNFTKRATLFALFFFVFVMGFIIFLSPLTENKPIDFDGIWADLAIGAIFSVIYGLVMARFVYRPQSKELTQ